MEALFLGIFDSFVYEAGIGDPGAVYYRIALVVLGITRLSLLAILAPVGQLPQCHGRFGSAGYFALMWGIVADSFGAIDLGLFLTLRGALFQVTFAVWLIVGEFSPRTLHDT